MLSGPGLCYRSDMQEALMAEADTKSVFNTPNDAVDEARLDARAEANIEAGRFVSHDRVAAWLKSWGMPNPLPSPRPLPEAE